MTIEDELQKLEARVASLERAINTTGHVPTGSKKALSVREFINLTKAETQNDRLLIIGYFYEAILGNGFFTNDDLKSGFAQAKMIGPKNISDAVAQNARKGLIMEHSSRVGRSKSWVLTNTGEAFVDSLMENNA